jgi:hypothetical protein
MRFSRPIRNSYGSCHPLLLVPAATYLAMKVEEWGNHSSKNILVAAHSMGMYQPDASRHGTARPCLALLVQRCIYVTFANTPKLAPLIFKIIKMYYSAIFAPFGVQKIWASFITDVDIELCGGSVRVYRVECSFLLVLPRRLVAPPLQSSRSSSTCTASMSTTFQST